MLKEDAINTAFEIVAYSGDARSKLLLALNKAQAGDFSDVDSLVDDAKECLADAHRSQTTLLTSEARGENVDITFITVHAQDHLMTTLLLKDLIDTLLDIYRKD